jgi:hypothetical protein
MQGRTDLDVDDVMSAGARPVVIPEGQEFTSSPTAEDVLDVLMQAGDTAEFDDVFDDPQGSGLGVLSEVDEHQDG